ncbi:hypothetical protein QQP08_016020 [Theobroma cacao]|nr:hypothetical protein QQP08_016020 [Theobroma cacao]
MHDLNDSCGKKENRAEPLILVLLVGIGVMDTQKVVEIQDQEKRIAKALSIDTFAAGEIRLIGSVFH